MWLFRIWFAKIRHLGALRKDIFEVVQFIYGNGSDRPPMTVSNFIDGQIGISYM